jgi:hypothetical protein
MSGDLTVSSQQWSHWIAALDAILQEADHHQEHIFGIHVNQAIEVAEARLAAVIDGPKPDQILPKKSG